MLSSGSRAPAGAGRLESEDAVTENMKRILMVGVPLIAVAGVWRLFIS
jgi:hypothetical protein